MLRMFCCAVTLTFGWCAAPQVDAHESAEPLNLRWEYPTLGVLPQAMVHDATRPFLYVALKAGGVAVFQLDGRTAPPTRVSVITKDQLGDMDAMNLAMQGRYLYVALGDLFARRRRPGLAVIDMTDPADPGVLSLWQSDDVLKGSACVEVSDGFAYLGAMSAGIMTFDVSDAKTVRHLATYQPDIHYPRRDPNSIQHPNARGMAVRGNLLFLAYDAGGLRVIDISQPLEPMQVARYINATMGPKPQAYNNIVLDGNLAYIAIDYAGLEIVDISDLDNIHQVGWWNPWNAQTPANNWFNSPGHTNQLVLDSRRKRVYLSAGDSELVVVDVSDPAEPRSASSFGQPRNGAGVWGLTVKDQDVFLAYIRTWIPFRGTWSGIKAVKVGLAPE